MNNIKSKIRIDNFLNEDPINTLPTRKYCQLCQCIGIAFDNAIEATKENKDAQIYVYLSENKNNIEIKFYNEFSSLIDIDQLGVSGVTSKDNHLGMGLNYLFNKTRLNVKSFIRNNMFVIEINVKK